MAVHTTVYIDLGHHTIKLATFEKKGKILSLKEVAFEKTELKPNESLIEGFDQVCATLSALMKRLSLKPKDTQLSITLPGEFFFTRLIKLPVIDPSKVRAVLKYEAQQEIPFSLHEVIWDYQILGSPDQEHLNVHLIAIKSEFVYNLLQTLEINGLENVKYIGPSPLAVSYAFSSELFEDIHAFINIGDKSSDIIVKSPHSIWFRTLPVGGNTFTHAVEQQLKIQYNEAENLKCQKGCLLMDTASMPKDSIDEIIAKAMTAQAKRLVAELTRSLSYYHNQHKEGTVKSIHLVGGGAATQNIAEFLQQQIDIPVQIADPTAKIQSSTDVKDKLLLSELVGMAQKHGYGKELPPNLLPSSYQKAQLLSKRKRAILQCGMLVLLLLAGPIFYHWKVLYTKQSNLEEARNYLIELNNIKNQMGNLEKKINVNIAHMHEIEKIVTERGLWLNILLDLEKRLPPNIWLSRVISSHTKKPRRKSDITPSKGAPQGNLLITLYCRTTGDYRDAENFTRALEDSKSFKHAEIQSATPPIQGIRNFIIRMEFDPTYQSEKKIKS